MEKQTMEAKAIARYVRGSTRKTNQVLDLVRGKSVDNAMQTLQFSTKHVARTVLKVLKSAVANATVQEARLHTEDLFVKECLCGPAPIMKRFLPRAQGRATPLLKRSCHITIIVGTKARKGAAVAAPTPATTAAPKAAPKTAAKSGATKAAASKAAPKKKTAAKKAVKAKSPARAAAAGKK
ncbi:MAG TPA: 50S ribosomal protein L22 [Candidatus Eisenbacteria bacterium]